MKKLFLAVTVVCLMGAGVFAAEQQLGDRVKIGGDVIVKAGETVKDATAIRGNVTVNGVVEGKATAVFGKVSIGPKGIVKGDAVSILNSVELLDGARVFGNITEINPSKMQGFCPASLLAGGFLGLLLIKLIAALGFLALALLFVAVFPEYTSACVDRAEQGILKPFLIGILGSVLIIPVGLVLLISVIGILLIPVEIVLVLVAALMGYVVAGAFIGKKLIAAFGKSGALPVWNALTGILVLWAASFVPFFGPFVNFLAFILGFGIVIVSLRRIRKNA